MQKKQSTSLLSSFTKKTFLLLLLFSFFQLDAFLDAQSSPEADLKCGTELSEANLEYLKKLDDLWRQSSGKAAATGPTQFVPVQLHTLRQNAGTGGISSADFLAAIDRMNAFYINADIHFFQCAPINFIDDNTYYDYDKSQMAALHAAHGVNNVVNIYVANTVTSGGNAICGHAQFPGGLDFVMQSTSCAKNGSTLAHEVGHYMGLYHTHETFLGAELVNGSNCLVAGDRMCDTPADPRLSTSTNLNRAGCNYYGATTDANGQAYTPSPINIMSYSGKECRTEFSTEQYARMLFILQNSRAYLSCGSVPALGAFFYANPTASCSNSKTYQFCNASEGVPTTWSWDFGDGVGSSNLEHPSYTYNTAGIFIVTLTATKGASVSTYTEKVVIGAVSLPYSNGFEAGVSAIDQFTQTNTMRNTVAVSAGAANTGSFGLLYDGTETASLSPSFQTPNTVESFQTLWNPFYKSMVEICVNATNFSGLQLEFDKRQIRTSNDDYTHFRVIVNGAQIGSVYQVNVNNTDDPAFTHITIDLSAYDGQVISIGLEGTHKYDKDRSCGNCGSATFIDNINITATPVLAFEELNFVAVQKDNWVELKWETLSQTPVDHFLLERSKDGFSWEEFAEVPTASKRGAFQTTDHFPFTGLSYYRLNQIDQNGDRKVSDVQIVNYVKLSSLEIYPNPATSNFSINMDDLEGGRINVFNSMGQEVHISRLDGPESARFDLNGVAPGTYFVLLRNGRSLKQGKLIIQ